MVVVVLYCTVLFLDVEELVCAARLLVFYCFTDQPLVKGVTHSIGTAKFNLPQGIPVPSKSGMGPHAPPEDNRRGKGTASSNTGLSHREVMGRR